MSSTHLIDADYIARHGLIAGNLEAPTAICALWKDLTRVDFSPQALENISLIGNLYTLRGISLLLRGLWRNPHIRHLTLWGPDTQHTGSAVYALWQDGVSASRAIGDFECSLDKSISDEAIEHLRHKVTLYDYRSIRELPELLRQIAGFERLPPHAAPRLFPIAEPEPPATLPSLGTGWQLTDRTVAKAWTRLLDLVTRFGTIKGSQYQMRQRELLNSLVVVTHENAREPDLPDYLPLNAKSLSEYLPRIIEDSPANDLSYTYGNRLRSYFERDQVENMLTQLRKSSDTRRAVAVLWDPRTDPERDTPPCLIQVVMNIVNDRLYLTYSARSQDVFAAWPQNTLGLRALQETAAAELGLALGPITTHTVSAHIYEHDWEQASVIVTRQQAAHRTLSFDPQGNFLIRTEDGQIVVELLDPVGQVVVWQARSPSAAEIGADIASLRLASEPSHYVYLGRELQRAQEALRRGETYDQGRA